MLVSYIDGPSSRIDSQPAPFKDGLKAPAAQVNAHFIHGFPLLTASPIVVFDKRLRIVVIIRADLIKNHFYYLVHIFRLPSGHTALLYPEDPWLQLPENR